MNSTKCGIQKSTEGSDQISTKREDLYLKDIHKEYSNNKSQTEKETPCVPPEIRELISGFSKERGNEKTEELLLTWMDIRRIKKATDTEGTVKANLEALPEMAQKSDMSINDYLSYIIRKGWKDLYPKGESRNSFRRKTGAEAGITCEPDVSSDASPSSVAKEDNPIPDDILEMFGEGDTAS